MKQIIDYRVLMGIEQSAALGPKEDLESQVRNLIADGEGWEPQGGVTVDSGKRRDGSIYVAHVQAMVKSVENGIGLTKEDLLDLLSRAK